MDELCREAVYQFANGFGRMAKILLQEAVGFSVEVFMKEVNLVVFLFIDRNTFFAVKTEYSLAILKSITLGVQTSAFSTADLFLEGLIS